MSFYLHDGYTLLLIFSAIFFTFLIAIDKKRLPLLIQYTINQKYALLYHKQNQLWLNTLIAKNTIILITIIISFWFPIETMSFQVFIKILIVLLLFFLIKIIGIYIIGELFTLLNYSKKYYQSTCSNLFLISLIFYPLIVFFSYFNNGELIINHSVYLFYLFFVIYILSKILIMQRLNLFQFQFMFYNILYLCTFEVLPYVGLFKLLDSLY